MTLWALAGFADVLCCCEIEPQSDGCALGVRMGDEFILTEWLPGLNNGRASARPNCDGTDLSAWLV